MGTFWRSIDKARAKPLPPPAASKQKPFGDERQKQVLEYLHKLEQCYIEVLTSMSLTGFEETGEFPSHLAYIQRQILRAVQNKPE